MPPLNTIPILGNVLFFAKGYKLPVSFSKPSGDPVGKQYNDAWQPSDRIAIPQLIPPWFMPAEIPNKAYQKSCDTIGQGMKDLHDSMINAVVFAHNMWKLTACFSGLQVMAVTAIGNPGCLISQGPPFDQLIKTAPMCAAFSGNKGKYRDAVATGVGKCFNNWMNQVTVPGLPWYPAFAAFPGPMAPPMPNIPMPLITCISSQMSQIVAPSSMKSEMINALDGDLKSKDPDKHYEGLFESIATVLALAFLMWLPAQQVMLVLGMGPIPTFAPPFVPVGPVVGGNNIPAPGHLMA